MAKPHGYRWAVEWLAANDDCTGADQWSTFGHPVTVCLLADLFEKDVAEVGRAVARKHKELYKKG